MSTFILSFFIFAILMAGMAIGVIVNNKAIKGTCGGLNDIEGLDGSCDICEIKERCKRRQQFIEQHASHARHD